MDIIISNSAQKPIYQQIYEQISSQIINGKLKSNFCLPPIRTIAKELEISVITVKKAWEELERGGFINTVPGKGCFVAQLPEGQLSDKREKLASEKIRMDAEYYKSLGLSADEVVRLIRKYY